MKRILISLAAVGLVTAVTILFANPIALTYFNELWFSSDSWKLELNSHYTPELMTGWSLVSREDSAVFKPGILLTSTTYLVITPESLKSQLRIDPSGDSLVMRDGKGFMMQRLIFGSGGNVMIAAPVHGQSISFNGNACYLDNTPTVGAQNDYVNAQGVISGRVIDSDSLPVSGVHVFGGTGDFPPGSYTDDAGRFSFTCLAARFAFTFSKNSFVTQIKYMQVFPESSVVLDAQMKEVVSVLQRNGSGIPREYALSEPYPNPFNPSTTIQFSLPRDGRIQLLVFDVKGTLVDRLYSGSQRAGQFHAIWDASGFASGVYLIQLRAQSVTLTRKCLLIR